MRPPVPLTGLGADRRHPRAGARQAGDHATRGTRGGRVRRVECGSGDQLPGRWGTRTSGPQGRSPRLAHLGSRGLALPTLAHQGPTPIVGHQPCSNGRRHVWPRVLGIAVGEVHGARGARGDLVATAGTAGRVTRMAAWRTACLGPDRQRHLAPHQSTPIGLDCLERPAQRQAIAPRRSAPGTTPQSARWVGTQLGRERPRSSGTPHAIEAHPGHRFARGDRRWRLRQEARVDQTSQASGLYPTGHEPQMIHAFHMDRCHVYPSPDSSRVIGRSLQRKVKDL